MPRKSPTCKKCKEPLAGHLDRKICPSEHGHISTPEGFTCSHKSCDSKFTTLYMAHKHSTSTSCKYFEGTEEPTACPNECGKIFKGVSAKTNANIHANSTMCEKHPSRTNNLEYRTTISHTITDNKKYCSSCRLQLPIENFAKRDVKNETGLAYNCYSCLALFAMLGNLIKRARAEGHCTENLTLEYIKSLRVECCPVFGIPLQYGGAEQCDNSATIDAFIHSKGHSKDNLRIISKKANTIKNNSAVADMELLVNALKTWKEPDVEKVNAYKKSKIKLNKEQTSKICCLCGMDKPFDEYHKSTATTVGISNKCIRCSALSSMIKNAKSRGKKTGRGVEIDAQYLCKLTNNLTHCPVLNIPLLYGGTGSIKDGSASIDRFDNTKGYVKGNVWIISYKANRMKSDASLEEIEKVMNYMKGESV